MASIRYVDGSQVRAERPPGAVYLRVTLADDQCVLAARVKRVFPLSGPDDFLSIQGGDGKEVVILRHLDRTDADSREVIASELDRRYFTPQIGTIHELKAEAGMWRFSVETQRGPTEFYVRNWRDSAHEMTPGRWQITSVDGARFEIANLESLDANSRRLMDQLL